MEKPKIGFVGLGIMGLAMARNVQKAGYSVKGTSRSTSRREEAERSGIATVETPKQVAAECDAVLIIVTDPRAVQDVLGGPNGVLAAPVGGKTLIQMSTIDEESTLRFSEAVQDANMAFLDCPVAGSKKQVDAGQLILLAGGSSNVLDQWQDLLMAMGKKVVHAGGIGKGTALKLCINLIVSQMTTALCESVALANVLNVNSEKIFDVLHESPALDCGYFRIKEEALLKQDDTPAFSLDNMLKDVRFMEQAAKKKRLALPVTQAVRFVMEAASREGYGPRDLSVLTRILKPKTAVDGR